LSTAERDKERTQNVECPIRRHGKAKHLKKSTQNTSACMEKHTEEEEKDE